MALPRQELGQSSRLAALFIGHSVDLGQYLLVALRRPRKRVANVLQQRPALPAKDALQHGEGWLVVHRAGLSSPTIEAMRAFSCGKGLKRCTPRSPAWASGPHRMKTTTKDAARSPE